MSIIIQWRLSHFMKSEEWLHRMSIFRVWPRHTSLETIESVILKANSHIPCRAPAVLRPFRFATCQGHSRGKAWYVWINIGRLSTACGLTAQVRFLPTTTRSFTIGSSNFSCYTRIFTKDTALSEHGRGPARYVWISATRHCRGTTLYVWISLKRSPCQWPLLLSCVGDNITKHFQLPP
jgi:hypothetical protein